MKDDLKEVIEKEEETKEKAESEPVGIKGMFKRAKESTGQTTETKPPPMENVPLFGEDDLIINTLEFELAEVKKSIEKALMAKFAKDILITELEGRREKMVAAIDVIYDRHADDQAEKEPEVDKEEKDTVEEPDGFSVDKFKPEIPTPPEEVAPEE